MRRLLLTLPDSVEDQWCGECPHLDHGAHRCAIFGKMSMPIRHADCYAAEVAASRLVDIAPEDAAKRTHDHHANTRVTRALDKHGKKAPHA